MTTREPTLEANVLDPIIEHLADARDNAGRARILLAMPLTHMLRYQMTIENRMRVAGFDVGAAYVAALCSAQRAVRPVKADLADTVDRLQRALLRICARSRSARSPDEAALEP